MPPSTRVEPEPRLPMQPNPFASAAFGSPWTEITGDVSSINEAPFRAIMTELSQMRLGSRGTSFVITGEPGSGKTHLLGRLRRSIQSPDDGSGPSAFYIYVRCNASAVTLWRHVRHALVDDLLKPSMNGSSPLQALLEQPRRLDLIAGINVKRALEGLRDGRHVHAAEAWLRGEPLHYADLAALGIATDKDDEDRSREAEARQFVNAILSFLAPTPTVICFDQVEGLESYRGEEAGFHAMGQLISDLNDNHENLLLISCIVTDYEPMFERLANKADRDRWLQNKLTLPPIDWEQALQLMQVRLDSAPALVPLRAAHPRDPLWPLDSQPLKPLFAQTGLCLPRTLLQACKRQFQLLLNDAPPPKRRSPEEFFQEIYAANLQEASRNVRMQGGDKTLGECLPWLLQSSGLKMLGQTAQRGQYANFAYRSLAGETAVAICYGSGNELTSRVKKIARLWTGPPPHLKLLRDATVKPGAAGAGLLNNLKSRGAEEIYPLPEALAALQAIRNLTTTRALRRDDP